MFHLELIYRKTKYNIELFYYMIDYTNLQNSDQIMDDQDLQEENELIRPRLNENPIESHDSTTVWGETLTSEESRNCSEYNKSDIMNINHTYRNMNEFNISGKFTY